METGNNFLNRPYFSGLIIHKNRNIELTGIKKQQKTICL